MSDFQGERVLIVGLGNPGTKYEGTRHNIGFDLIRRIAEIARINLGSSSFDGLSGAGEFAGKKVVLLLPQTFMNLSGISVAKAAKFYRIAPEDIIVAHDEIEIAPGTIRLKRGGGHAGHNGLRSIDQQLGNKNYLRVRLGVGRPDGPGDVSNWVLSRFVKADEQAVEDLMFRGTDAVELLLKEGLTPAQNVIHPLK